MTLPVRWVRREPPLEPAGVLGLGAVADRLIERAVLGRAPGWRALRCVAIPGTCVLLGDDLPWVDGARYLGRDPQTPEVLWPTTRRPDVPLPLMVAALLAHHDGLTPPFAVWPGHVLPLAGARPLDDLRLGSPP